MTLHTSLKPFDLLLLSVYITRPDLGKEKTNFPFVTSLHQLAHIVKIKKKIAFVYFTLCILILLFEPGYFHNSRD
jgi:hypothetical protein